MVIKEWNHAVLLSLTLALTGGVSLGQSLSGPTVQWSSSDTVVATSGLNPIADDAFDSLGGSGWHPLDNTQNLVSLIQDSAAPFSRPFVLQYQYPIGFPGGIGPGAASRDLPNVTTFYAGIWWKVSNPWQGHPANVNKVEILSPAEGGDLYLVMYGTPGGPYEPRVIPQFKG